MSSSLSDSSQWGSLEQLSTSRLAGGKFLRLLKGDVAGNNCQLWWRLSQTTRECTSQCSCGCLLTKTMNKKTCIQIEHKISQWLWWTLILCLSLFFFFFSHPEERTGGGGGNRGECGYKTNQCTIEFTVKRKSHDAWLYARVYIDPVSLSLSFFFPHPVETIGGGNRGECGYKTNQCTIEFTVKRKSHDAWLYARVYVHLSGGTYLVARG